MFKEIIKIKRRSALKNNGWKKNSFKDWYHPEESSRVINDNSLAGLSDKEFDDLIKATKNK